MALTTAFARNGNRKAVPQTTADGSVSYNEGFGAFYALPPEEGGLFIDRAQFNQIMYDTTSAVITNQNSINTLNGSVNTLNTKVANIERGVATGVVNLTTNQTVGGIKTFSVPPVSATNPSNNNQVANKAYVDSVGNTAVKLTGTQSIAGAKTFTSNITAPNITAMQNSINTINASLNTVVSNEFTPYLILKSSPLAQKTFNLTAGATQNDINETLAEASKYRFVKIVINGTVKGTLGFNQVNYCELLFNAETAAKLIGAVTIQNNSYIRIININIESGYLFVQRFSKVGLLSNVNISAPSGSSAIEIGSNGIITTDQTASYPSGSINLRSDNFGISLENNAQLVLGRELVINTTNTNTKINLSRGSFASLAGVTLNGDGNDFNIATNTVTASGIIMR